MLGKLTAGGRQQAIAGIVGDGPVGRGDRIGYGYGWGGDHEGGRAGRRDSLRKPTVETGVSIKCIQPASRLYYAKIDAPFAD
jgi:hypothetical protein